MNTVLLVWLTSVNPAVVKEYCCRKWSSFRLLVLLSSGEWWPLLLLLVTSRLLLGLASSSSMAEDFRVLASIVIVDLWRIMCCWCRVVVTVTGACSKSSLRMSPAWIFKKNWSWWIVIQISPLKTSPCAFYDVILRVAFITEWTTHIFFVGKLVTKCECFVSCLIQIVSSYFLFQWKRHTKWSLDSQKETQQMICWCLQQPRLMQWCNTIGRNKNHVAQAPQCQNQFHNKSYEKFEFVWRCLLVTAFKDSQICMSSEMNFQHKNVRCCVEDERSMFELFAVST